MHRLLQRQLRRIYTEGIPNDPEFAKLIELVNEGYQNFDEQLMITERSLDISCNELTQRNQTLNLILDSLPDMSLWVDKQGNVKDIRSGNFEPPLLNQQIFQTYLSWKLYEIRQSYSYLSVTTNIVVIKVLISTSIVQGRAILCVFG